MSKAIVANVGWVDSAKRVICATHHKDIGALYLGLSGIMFFVAGSVTLLIHVELFQPGLRLLTPEFFNQMSALHGLIMVFGVVLPAFAGFANRQIPMMIGASDMAFPRLNSWSFWMLPFALTILAVALLIEGPASNFGWTFYAPLSTIYRLSGSDFFIFSVYLMGLSSIATAINIIVTIMNLRAPGMDYRRMPLFVWAGLIGAVLLLAIMPVLVGTVTLMLTDHHFGTGFFNTVGGGNPLFIFILSGFTEGSFNGLIVSLFAIIAGVYYALPTWCGYRHDERLAKWHFWLTVISMNVTFFPIYFLGLAGMPRRVPDYALQFTDCSMITRVGAFVFGFSQLIFLYLIIKAIRGHGRPDG